MSHIATKTLAAIEAAIVSDQGARYRELLRELMPTAEDAYRGDDPPFRTHLGASMLGRACTRDIWYGFRWVTMPHFEARMLRLFNRGHLEEPRMLALLQLIGCTVYYQDTNGKQFRIGKGHRGHGGGGMDGVAVGVPDMPGIPLLTEFKTHGEKSYLKLVDEGLMKAKWEHFVQMQLYMGDRNLTHGLYMATNKNTDHIHAEIVTFDQRQYEQSMQRQKIIIDSEDPPLRIGGAKDDTFFKCRLCDHAPTCWKGKAPAVTCRTCKNVAIGDGGQWGCMLLQQVLTADEQRAACSRYEIKPTIWIKPA